MRQLWFTSRSSVAPRRMITGLVSLALTLASCAEVPAPDLTKSEGAEGESRIAIVSPAPGETVEKVEIVTEVEDFELVKKIGKKAKKGEGHILYYRLDSADAGVPIAEGEDARTGGRGAFTVFPSHKPSYTWPIMPSRYYPPGDYTFVVQLVNNDYTPLSPPQVALVSVTVAGDLEE